MSKRKKTGCNYRNSELIHRFLKFSKGNGAFVKGAAIRGFFEEL